jgi:hypothetical protein
VNVERLTPWALLVSGCFTATLALATEHDPLAPVQLAVGIAIVASGGFLLGCRRTRAAFVSTLDNAIARLPGSIAFHEDDDGHLHALVVTRGGDLRTIDVPDEQAGSPTEAVAYVCETLGSEL